MIKQSKVNNAVNCFNDGFNCSQAIFSTYCEEFGMDKNIALKVSCGFGAGMGRLQKTCGAVSGAYLLIGLIYGKYSKEDDVSKEKTYSMIQKFTKLFEERNKTTNCRELLCIDLINDDKKIVLEQIKKVCPKMIQDAAEIIESILFTD